MFRFHSTGTQRRREILEVGVPPRPSRWGTHPRVTVKNAPQIDWSVRLCSAPNPIRSVARTLISGPTSVSGWDWPVVGPWVGQGRGETRPFRFLQPFGSGPYRSECCMAWFHPAPSIEAGGRICRQGSRPSKKCSCRSPKGGLGHPGEQTAGPAQSGEIGNCVAEAGATAHALAPDQAIAGDDPFNSPSIQERSVFILFCRLCVPGPRPI